MALAKDRILHDSNLNLSQISDLSSPKSYPIVATDVPTAMEKAGFNYHHEISHSVINFKNGIENLIHHSNESLLSFEHGEPVARNTTGYLKGNSNHKDEYLDWEGNLNNSYQWNNDQRVSEDVNCFQTATNYGSMETSPVKETLNGSDESGYGWLYSEASVVGDSIHESEGPHESGTHKRPHRGESVQGQKKQCTSANKKSAPKSSPAKDPQSIAAKNRRERISERLKILQELVPNGSKVDLVTMLEKAISYVKFLQLQVKILATDEFWPVQGGKAPDITQVREAIDAILSSQRDRSSSSNSSK